MKVLVLGGSGFLGNNIVKEFSKNHDEVISFDLHHESIFENVSYIDGNVFTDDIFKIIDKCDCIIYAVCTIRTNNCDETFKNAYRNDFIKGVEIFEYCSIHKKKVIYLSSGGTVYGDPDVIPTDELQPLRPISHYGVLKVALENAAHVFNNKYGLNILSARIANPYGPGQDYKKGIGFIDAILRKSLNSEEITIFGDGSIVRDYIYVEDVARILVDMAHSPFNFEEINIGTGVGTSQNEIIDIFKELGYNSKVVYTDKRGFDVKKNILDIKRLKSVYKDELVNLRDGIKAYISYILKETKL